MVKGRTLKAKWANSSDDHLLSMRMCDLDLRLEGTWLERPVAMLHEELEAAGLLLRPHVWLSEEWFSPGGIPGIAIPFFLAHPRLMRLERKQMLEVEGGTLKWCMKILRHEAGHAIQHAFDTHRRKQWQALFGRSSKHYPESYLPRPASKRFVLHLDRCYAQSHPDEDFAETFAVWLTPRSQWRTRYQGWPALKKLEYVDELMHELSGKRPTKRSRVRIEPVSQIKKTLGEHYEQRRLHYGSSYPDIYDRDLKRVFTTPDGGRAKGEAASTFLRRHRREIGAQVARWTGEYQFTLDQVLRDMIGRVRELNLRAVGPERQLKIDFSILLTVQTMHYLYAGRRRHPL